MSVLGWVGVLALFLGGVVACFGGYLCRVDIDRAGVFAHPWAGVAAVVYFLGFNLLAVSTGANPLMMVFLAIPLGFLYAPLLAYHGAQVLGSAFSTASALPPDPDDPFERAKAAEERGDARGAVERYEWLLERETAHFDARVRLAELLARTGRLRRATDVLDKGLALPEAEGWMRFKWQELRLQVEERSFGEARPEDGKPTFKALGDVRPARLEAWNERHRAGDDGDDGPLDASSLDDDRA